MIQKILLTVALVLVSIAILNQVLFPLLGSGSTIAETLSALGVITLAWIDYKLFLKITQ